MWGLGINKQTNKHNTQMIEQKTTWRHGDSRSPRQLSFQRATSPPDGLTGWWSWSWRLGMMMMIKVMTVRIMMVSNLFLLLFFPTPKNGQSSEASSVQGSPGFWKIVNFANKTWKITEQQTTTIIAFHLRTCRVLQGGGGQQLHRDWGEEGQLHQLVQGRGALLQMPECSCFLIFVNSSFYP